MKSPSAGADRFIQFKRVEPGWYRGRAVRRHTGDECWIHVVRVSKSRPRMGWMVVCGDDKYEVPPRGSIDTIDSGLSNLIDAQLAAEERFMRAPSANNEVKP